MFGTGVGQFEAVHPVPNPGFEFPAALDSDEPVVPRRLLVPAVDARR